MIRVKGEPVSRTWNAWKAKAQAEIQRLIAAYAAGQPITINEDLYQAERDTILRHFNRKCAYCEVLITAGGMKGDVEHFRPKGRVMELDGKPVVNKNSKHPGYFWLAFDWQNLLPSCISCNRPSTTLDSERIGKWDFFPIRGVRAFEPGHEIHEDPLLLNPWVDEPNEHLIFDVDTAIIGYKTDRGKVTRDLLGLNREGLIQERKQVITFVRLQFIDFQAAFQRGEARADSALVELRRPELQSYSAMRRSVLVAELTKAHSALTQLGP